MNGAASGITGRWRVAIVALLGVWLLVACNSQSETAEVSLVNGSETTGSQAPSIGPSQVAPIALKPLWISKGESDQGWISYRLSIAIINNNDMPVTLVANGGNPTPGSQNGTDEVTLLTGDVVVHTDQGNSYPATIDSSDLEPLVIPVGATVTAPRTSWFDLDELQGVGWDFKGISAEFRVPELLHPTTLVINNGLLFDGVASSPSLDVASATDGGLEPVNSRLVSGKLTSFQNDSIAVSIQDVPDNIATYHPAIDCEYLDCNTSLNLTSDQLIWSGPTQTGMFVQIIDVTLHNTNITGDEPVALAFTVLDDYGFVYQHTMDKEPLPEDCASLPDGVGPGQTVVVRLCFGMPEAYAGRTNFLHLVVATANSVNVFDLDSGPEVLSNCVAAALPARVDNQGDLVPVETEYTASAPDEVSGTIRIASNYDALGVEPVPFDRINVQATGSETISIRVSPGKPGGERWSDTQWKMILQDPSGASIFNVTFFSSDEVEPLFANVNLWCTGVYSFYLRPQGFGVQEDSVFPYVVTIEEVPPA